MDDQDDIPKAAKTVPEHQTQSTVLSGENTSKSRGRLTKKAKIMFFVLLLIITGLTGLIFNNDQAQKQLKENDIAATNKAISHSSKFFNLITSEFPDSKKVSQPHTICDDRSSFSGENTFCGVEFTLSFPVTSTVEVEKFLESKGFKSDKESRYDEGWFLSKNDGQNFYFQYPGAEDRFENQNTGFVSIFYRFTYKRDIREIFNNKTVFQNPEPL